MTSEDRVLAALKTLAEEERGAEAPPRVERRLMAAFRRKRAVRRWRMAAMGVAAAGALLIVAPWPRPEPAPVPAAKPPAAAAVAAVPTPPPPEVKKAVLRAKAAPAPRPVREVATEFYPLVDIAPPFESGELLRVIVPASTMGIVGLPVRRDRWTEPVEADILFGQEGIARAIRFVSYEQ
jgi:hypothetical protein